MVFVKGQCLIQEDMKERGGNQLSLHFACFLNLTTLLVPLFTGEGEGMVDTCHQSQVVKVTTL